MNRAQARAQARQEADMAHGLRRAGDNAWVKGRRAEAERLYADASQHDAVCDELCSIAAGTKKAMTVAPSSNAVVDRVAPTDF